MKSALIEKGKSIYRTNPELIIFSVITIAVISCFCLLYFLNGKDVEKIEKSYTGAYYYLCEHTYNAKKLDSINLCSKLKTTYLYIDELKRSKLYLAALYQRFFLICYTIGLVFIVLTTVTGFVITKKGWDISGRKRKALLLTFAFYSILLSAYPKLFDQEKNFRINFSDYAELSKCQFYIFDVLAPYIGKTDNSLSQADSSKLNEASDTIKTILTNRSNIDIVTDPKLLEPKQLDY